MSGCLDGRVAIITGAAQGQGAAEALLFAENGAHVIATDIKDASESAARAGNGAVYQHLDVSSRDDWTRVVAFAVQRFGRIDILINNAGIHWVTPFEQETLESFDRMLDVNLRGPFMGIQAVAPAMRAAGGGSVVNVASTAALKPHEGHVSYGVSKWGVRGLTQVAAAALACDRIRVNTILPGGVNTAMAHGALTAMTTLSSEEITAMLEQSSADPRELAEVALFLASDRASYLTGAELVADGGSTIGTRLPRPIER